MRVFMLGWEFPPMISGGLGTACYGLTKSLSRQQMQITFVLPKATEPNAASHVRLLGPHSIGTLSGERKGHGARVAAALAGHGEFANVKFKAVPSRVVSPYQSSGGQLVEWSQLLTSRGEPARSISTGSTGSTAPSGAGIDYNGDLIDEARRFAETCLNLAIDDEIDVIHAHDWMTFPAGLAVARVTGKPLVAHVHSTEFDRAGENVNQQVYDIERRGMHGAMRVIAVSYLTKSVIEHRYHVPSEKIDVVYNGIENGQNGADQLPHTPIKRGDKIVLFLGRITMQKGPEYFVSAAKKVLQKLNSVKFVMAGSGDKVRDVIEQAVAEGIGHRVLFTGFLRGEDVRRVFQMADVYVMPSVSEPFGIAPLEAIRHDVPVIISKTSGVAEVITHALKVDFWDTDDIANKILAVLRHPPLSNTLREQADLEVRRLTWDDAAWKCQAVYRHVTSMMPG